MTTATPSPVTIEPIPVHGDARGCVFEPMEADLLPAQRNVHVVLTEPGAVRGNHSHPRGTEVMVVRGPMLVRTRDGGEVIDTHVPPGEVFRFTIPAGVAHAVQNTGGAPSLLISFVDVPHDPARPNVVHHPLL
jgi:UDP-2-acetamido-2,6-beta-L-arabino-hexul-4-ose reductase